MTSIGLIAHRRQLLERARRPFRQGAIDADQLPKALAYLQQREEKYHSLPARLRRQAEYAEGRR